jgi:membrane-bound metal-dependent hydrolase YbcI (DUF457 family)
MEPVTHALTSLALARATRERLPRYGTAMLIVAGVAPDLDFAAYFGGPVAYLRFHRAVLHSFAGGFLLCCCIAAAFYFWDRRRARGSAAEVDVPRVRFLPVLETCVAGAGLHVLMDVASGIGVRLWWPIRGGWVAWDWLANFDVFILALLVAGLLLPHFVRMVSEEIGEERHGVAGGVGAAIILILLGLYVGGRGFLHARAVDLLLSRDYHGEPPQRAGAFASAANPFEWRGVVATASTVEELQLSMLPGPAFDPDQAVAHYKPDDSAAIAAAQNTADAKLFLSYARFPMASVEPRDDGFEVELRDLRFPADDHSADNVIVSVRVDANSRVRDGSLRYAHARR